MAETNDVQVTVDGGIGTIRLCRPDKRNAMRYTMWTALESACRALADDRAVRVVVLRAEGQHFCAGADIRDLHATRPEGMRPFMEVNLAAEDALAGLPKPTIAAIDGDCVGGGCALAIDCDLRLATPRARFGITPAKLGLVYPPASLRRAVALLGAAVTKQMIFTGELYDAAWAARVGLVDEVTDDLDAALERWCATLRQRSLLSQSATKQMIDQIVRTGDVPDDIADHWQRLAQTSGEAAEGSAAFAERRPPAFAWAPDHGGR